MPWVVAMVAGFAIGGAIGYLLARQKGASAEAQAALARAEIDRYRVELSGLRDELGSAQREVGELKARLEEGARNLEDQRRLLDDAEKRLTDTFKSLAGEALRNNNAGFLDLAGQKLETIRIGTAGDIDARKREIETLVKPLGDSLAKITDRIGEIEKARGEAYGALRQQLVSLVDVQGKLRGETANLVAALRAPKVRGRWGEVQLRRVVELAGMVDRCDFFEQETIKGEHGAQRPDLRVQLPGKRNIVVDSKVPFDAYLEALSAGSEDERIAKLKRHSEQVRARVAELSSKRYWQSLEPAPEFVVLFLPAESFYDAALQFDPTLIEDSAAQRVILSTPTTLIALLKAVAYGWKQEEVEENARAISQEGRQLYDRIIKVAELLAKIGAGLETAVNAFNGAIGSFETRLMVSARRLKELGASSHAEVPQLKVLETRPREPQAIASEGERTTATVSGLPRRSAEEA